MPTPPFAVGPDPDETATGREERDGEPQEPERGPAESGLPTPTVDDAVTGHESAESLAGKAPK